MMKWIRWQGLIAFAAVVGALAAFWLLFADSIVGSLIEKTGMKIVGAEVDVKADVHLFPLGVTLRDLEVTNPQAPETNSFECARIAFGMDGLNLLRNKVIINEMAVEGMRFDTPRKHRGRVTKVSEKEKAAEKQSLVALAFEKPDIKKILKNENLESVKLIETAQAEVRQKKAGWQKRIEELPDRNTLDAYRARIDKLRQLPKSDVFGMAEGLGEVRALRRDIEQDIGRVRSVRAAFTNDFASARALVDKAQKAPMNDVRRLRDKYSITPAGLANMTQLLFGDKLASYVRSGLLWHNRIKPIVERAKAKKGDATVVKHLRGKGVDVQFREYRPLPDFLIARTAVSAEVAAGLLGGAVHNITPDQDILRIPLTFELTGEKLQAAGSMALTGVLNHIIPAKPEDKARFSTRGLRVKNLVLSEIKQLPIAMQEAQVDFDVDGSITEALKAGLQARINSAKLNVGGEGGDNPFIAAVRTALSKVSKFNLSADITGTLDDLKMAISSDLDKVLKSAVGSVVKEQAANLEQQLKALIRERTGGPLRDLQTSLGVMNQQGAAIDNIQKQLNSLLQETIKQAGGGRLKLP